MNIIITLSLVQIASADLIGWNRMANNLNSHSRYLNFEKLPSQKKSANIFKIENLTSAPTDTLSLKRILFEQRTGMTIEEYKRNILRNRSLRRMKH